MAHRSGPTRDEADNKAGHHRPVTAIGSPCAKTHHGPGNTISQHEAEDTFAVRTEAPSKPKGGA